MSQPSEDRAAAWLAQFVDGASQPEEARRVTAEIDAAILAETPQLAADSALVTELHASTQAHFRAFIGLLQRTQPELLMPPQAVDLALSIARRQLDLGVLLKVYRVADHAVWDYFKVATEVLADDAPLRTEVLIYLWERGRTWIDGSIEQLIGVFSAEREASMHSMLARQAEVVHEVLRGGPIAVDAATTELRYQLRANHLALVLWVDGDHGFPDAVPHINAAAESLAGPLASGKPLLVATGNREVWAWLPVPRGTTAKDLDDAVGQLRPLTPIRVAAGIPAGGIAGFRQSHREALDTQRLLINSGSGVACASYSEVELVSLIAANPDAAQALVRRELAGLAEDVPALEKVRETLLGFLANGGNVDAVAGELQVHKNTVRYRLGQAADLVGHPLSERRTEMELALRYVDMHGTGNQEAGPAGFGQKYKTGGPDGSTAPITAM